MAKLTAAQRERDKIYQGASAALADAAEAAEALVLETPQAGRQARAAGQAHRALQALRELVGTLEAQEPSRGLPGSRAFRAQRTAAARLDREMEALVRAVRRAEAWRVAEAQVEAELRAANRQRDKGARRVAKLATQARPARRASAR